MKDEGCGPPRLRAIGIAVALLAAAVACGQREQELPEAPAAGAESTVRFSAGLTDTRTAFGDPYTEDGQTRYPAFWTASDQEVGISLNYEPAVAALVRAAETDEGGRITRASFEASFSGIDTSAPYVFYAVSPASALLWPSASREGISVRIPSRQTPSAQSVDEAAQILMARSASFEALPADAPLHFSHFTAYGRLFLTNLSLAPGVRVTSVSLHSPDQPITGVWYGSFRDGDFQPKEASSSVILDVSGVDIAGGDPAWFAVAPVPMGGKPLKITAKLSTGEELVRTIVPREGLRFAPGRIARITVDMASAERVPASVKGSVYTLVRSLEELAVGEEVVFLDQAAAPGYAMTSTLVSRKGLAATAEGFTVQGDEVKVTSADILTLTVDTADGSSVKFRTAEGTFLGRPTSSEGAVDYLALGKMGAFTATVSIADGVARINYPGYRKDYYVTLAGDCFVVSREEATCALFRKTGATGGDLDSDPVLRFDRLGAYLSSGNYVYDRTRDQLVREYADDGTATFRIVDPLSEKMLTFSGIPVLAAPGDVFTLQLVYQERVSEVLNRAYKVTVLREDGSRLTLSDGLGNGFIVKR